MSRTLGAAGAMGAGTFMSRILGLVREQVFAYLFGAGNATDAFNIAFRIPNLLRDLFAEGAMSASLVPTFTRVRMKEGDRRAWRVAGLVFRALVAVSVVIAVTGIVFAPELVSLYASAYKMIPGKYELTVLMTRVMFPFFPLVALAAAYMGILNACGKFFFPAFASALFNLTSIVAGVVLAFVLPHFGVQPIVGMAIGVVLGGAVQAFSQRPVLSRAGYKWPGRPSGAPSWHADPALRSMMVMMIPGTIGLAATQINILVNSILATSQSPGAVSWLNYAFRLMQFPIGILGVSLAAATLPVVSRFWVDKNMPAVSGTITDSLKSVFAVNLPASAGLAFLGAPIIRMIFEYGRFTPGDTVATAAALAAYSGGLAAYSAVKVLVPACYAMGNTRIPVVSSVFSVVVTVVLNILMIGPFGYVGLAIGTSLAAVLNALMLLGAVRRLVRAEGGDFAFSPLAMNFALNFAASLVMGALCLLSYHGLELALPDVTLFGLLGKAGIVIARVFKVMLVIAEGGILVFALARLFGLKETSAAAVFFLEKLKNRVSTVRK